MGSRIVIWAGKAILVWIALSLVLVVLFRFVPVTYTATMLFDENSVTRDWEPLSRIDRNMVSAVIAAEDGKFCSHNGFDTEAIEQAIQERMAGERERGASTISQQTAKNVFLWQGGGWFRKGLEAWFTFLIETLWDKRRIMEVYLNVAETGIGTYGVEAGAKWSAPAASLAAMATPSKRASARCAAMRLTPACTTEPDGRFALPFAWPQPRAWPRPCPA
jgi:monofunctional glycosyltransferase